MKKSNNRAYAKHPLIINISELIFAKGNEIYFPKG